MRLLDKILYGLCIFLFLNNVSLNMMTSLTSSRLVFIVVVVMMMFKNKINFNLDNRGLSFFIFSVILAFYSACISSFLGGDLIQFSRLIHFSFYSIIAPFIVLYLIPDEKTFHESIVIATLIQVFFVVLTYTSPSFNAVLFSYVYSDGAFQENLARAPGFSSSGGAVLSVIISLGAFSTLKLSRLRKESWHLTVLLLITLSTIIVGRTGLLLCVMALLLYAPRVKVSVRPLLLSSFCAIVLYLTLLKPLLSNEQFINYTLNWAISGLNGSDGTASALLSMGLPSMSISEIIFGAGLVSLPNGLNASGSDVGYVQTYFSLGIILTVAFYSTFLLFLASYFVQAKDKTFILFLIAIMLLVEFKEPFIFKYFISFYVLTSILYSDNIKVVRRGGE
jgi:hypothetical protein